ncbi:MAG: dockerin type I repeat-containing protein, partial [Candidatus Zixiibacteriota bacterium]
WWEEAKQIKMFKSTASDIYKHFVIKYVTVKRHNPPAWWPDQTGFTGYHDTYVGVAEDIDAPFDTLLSESGRNYGGYDAVKDIAWQSGFYNDAHPAYLNYYAGVALAKIKSTDSQVPYSAHCLKNNVFLYKVSPWGYKDDQLDSVAADPTVGYVQDPDSAVDRNTVLVAKKIPAGNDPNASVTYAVIMAASPNGLSGLQTTIDTARAVVLREGTKGYPAICGDATGDGIINGGDVIYLVTYLYRGGPAPVCPMERGDATGDGIINGGDVIYLVTYLYRGGPAPNCQVGLW